MNTYQAKIGYARTSTVDQSLDAQIEALTGGGMWDGTAGAAQWRDA